MLAGRLSRSVILPWRGLSITFAFLLLIIAIRVYISRFELLLEDHTVFGGVTYTDAHVTLTGLLVVCIALVAGRAGRDRERGAGSTRARADRSRSSGRRLLYRAAR